MDGNAQNMFHGNHQGDPYYRYDPAAAAAAAAASPRAMGPPGGYPRHRAPHPLQQQPQYPTYQPATDNIYGLSAADQHAGMGMGDLSGWGAAPTVPGQAGAYPGAGLGAYGHPQAGPPSQQRQSSSQPSYRQHMPAYGQQDPQKLPYATQQSMMSGLLQQPGANVGPAGYGALPQQQPQQQQQQAPTPQQQQQQQSQQSRLPQHYPQAPTQHPLYPGAPTQGQPGSSSGSGVPTSAQGYAHSPYGAPMQHQPGRSSQHVGYGHAALEQPSPYGQHVPGGAAAPGVVPSHHLAAQQQAGQLSSHASPHMVVAPGQQQQQQQAPPVMQHGVPPGLGTPQQQQQSSTHLLQSQQQQQQQSQNHVGLMQGSTQHQQLPPPHTMGVPPTYGGHHQQQQQPQPQPPPAQQPVSSAPPYMTAAGKHQATASPQYRAPFPQLSPQMSSRQPTMSPHPQMSPRPGMSPAKPPPSSQQQQQQGPSSQTQQQPPVNSPSQQQQQPTHHSISGMVGLTSPRQPAGGRGGPEQPSSKANSVGVPPVNTLQALEQMVMPGQGMSSGPMDYPSAYRQAAAQHGPMGPRMPVSPQHHQQWSAHLSMQQSQQQAPPTPMGVGQMTVPPQMPHPQQQQHQQQMGMYGQPPPSQTHHQQQTTTQQQTPTQQQQQQTITPNSHSGHLATPASQTAQQQQQVTPPHVQQHQQQHQQQQQQQQQQQLSEQLQHSINDIVGNTTNSQQQQSSLASSMSPMHHQASMSSMHMMTATSAAHHQMSVETHHTTTAMMQARTATSQETQMAPSTPTSQPQLQQTPQHHVQQQSTLQAPSHMQQQQKQHSPHTQQPQHSPHSHPHQQQHLQQQSPHPHQQQQQSPHPHQPQQQTPLHSATTQQQQQSYQQQHQTQFNSQDPFSSMMHQQQPTPPAPQQQASLSTSIQQPETKTSNAMVVSANATLLCQQSQHSMASATMSPAHVSSPLTTMSTTITNSQQQQQAQLQASQQQQPLTPSTPTQHHLISGILNETANSNDSSTLAVAANDSNNSSSNSSTNSTVNNHPTSIHDSNSQSSINSNNNTPANLNAIETSAGLLNSNSNSATNVGMVGGGGGSNSISGGILESAGASLFDNNSMSSNSGAVTTQVSASTAAAAIMDSNSQSSFMGAMSGQGFRDEKSLGKSTETEETAMETTEQATVANTQQPENTNEETNSASKVTAKVNEDGEKISSVQTLAVKNVELDNTITSKEFTTELKADEITKTSENTKEEREKDETKLEENLESSIPLNTPQTQSQTPIPTPITTTSLSTTLPIQVLNPPVVSEAAVTGQKSNQPGLQTLTPRPPLPALVQPGTQLPSTIPGMMPPHVPPAPPPPHVMPPGPGMTAMGYDGTPVLPTNPQPPLTHNMPPHTMMPTYPPPLSQSGSQGSHMGYPPYPMLHQQEIAALQQQLQELYCMPPQHDHQEKIIRLQERLNIVQQHEITDQCAGGPQCLLYQSMPPQMYGPSAVHQTQIIESPQVSSTTGRGRGKGTNKPRKPRVKKSEKALVTPSSELMDISGNVVVQQTSIPPNQLPVSEDCVTQGAGDTSVVGMLEYHEGSGGDHSQDVHSANELDTSTDGTGKKKKPRKPRTPKDPNKLPKERTPKVKKIKGVPVEGQEGVETTPGTGGRKRQPAGTRKKKAVEEVDTGNPPPLAEGSENEDNKPLIAKSQSSEVAETESVELDNKPETTTMDVDIKCSTVEGESPDYDDIPVSKIPKGDESAGQHEVGDETIDSIPDSAGDSSATPSRRSKKKRGRGTNSNNGDDGEVRSGRRRSQLSAKALKKRRNRGRIVPESDGEDDNLQATPPPSPPPDNELDTSKRRSSRNTQRKKYIDDVMIRFSDDDTEPLLGSSPLKKEKKSSSVALTSMAAVVSGNLSDDKQEQLVSSQQAAEGQELPSTSDDKSNNGEDLPGGEATSSTTSSATFLNEKTEKSQDVPPVSAKPNYVYINTGDEDSMVVQYVLALRMGKRELLPKPPPRPPTPKKEVENPQTKEDENKDCTKQGDNEVKSEIEQLNGEEKKEDSVGMDGDKKKEDSAEKNKIEEKPSEEVESSEIKADVTSETEEQIKIDEKPSDVEDKSENSAVKEDKEKTKEEKDGDKAEQTIDNIEAETKNTGTTEKDNDVKMNVDEVAAEVNNCEKENQEKSMEKDKAKSDKKDDEDKEIKSEPMQIDTTEDEDKKPTDDKVEKEELNESSSNEAKDVTNKESDNNVCKKTEADGDKIKPEPVYIEVEEYLVKYRNFSYLHCEWRTEEELFKGDRRVAAKIRRFQQKQAQQMNVFENLEEEYFNPDFVEVDRVLDMSVHTDEQTGETTKHYLVKWKSLAYEDCTWELEEDVDKDKIEQYNRYNKVPPRIEWKPRKRPSSDLWKKLEKTPVYKGGNTLRPYQLEGLNWLKFSWYNAHNCILADEMGLGKTIQSLTFVHSVYEYGIKGPFLVIAPLSTIPNWQREFESWTDMNIVVYHGSVTSKQMIQDYEFFFKTESGKVLKEPTKFNVLITTFEMIVTDHMDLKNFNWRLCVIDEAHRLKNRNCKLLDGLRQLNLEHRVLLSGTPLQNNMSELFSLLNFLEPSQFSSAEEFMAEFGSLKTEEEVNKLQALLKPMMLRRLKDDVEKSLAPKEETIIEVELTNIQKKYYRGILEQNFAFLKKGTTSANIPNLMNTMMELRKCCIHPYLLNGAEEQIQYDYRHQHGEDPESYYKNIIHSSGKMVLIDKLLPKLKANGHRVLIFSQMVKCLDILEDYLIYRKYPFERIDGRIRGNLRQEAIDRYSKPGSDRFVFLLCTKAGGLGINLTAADTVIIYDSDWNPQNDLQAQARCHRIGQRKMVKIYRLLCRNTYEREMFDKASLKLGLDKAVLQSMNTHASKDGGNKQLSKKEIEDLLKKGAYGAVMDDDNAGDKFCEEDIDSILKRRTQVITMEQEKGSTFSKASFAASGNRSDITIDDPDFWTKWAKKADIDPDACEKDETEDLVLSEPRRRTQIKRYGHEDVMEINSEDSSNENSDEEGGIGLRSTRRSRKEKRERCREKKANDEYIPRERDALAALGLEEIHYGNWAKSECFKVEKGLLSFGWGRWAEILELGQFKRGWREIDVEDCARIILLYCLQVYKGDEKIKTFIWDLITPTEDGEIQKISRDHSGLHNLVPRGRNGGKTQKELAAQAAAEAAEAAASAAAAAAGIKPSPKKEIGTQGLQNIQDPNHWSKHEKYDADSYLEGAYKKHLSRHANKVLLRVRMLYYIQHEVIGDLVQQIKENTPVSELPIRPPTMAETVPASWWNPPCCDKSLLVGTFKHGCEMYRVMRSDPALCFAGHVGSTNDDVTVTNLPINEDDTNSKQDADVEEIDDDGTATKDSDSTKLTSGDKDKDSLDPPERPSSSGKNKKLAKKATVDETGAVDDNDKAEEDKEAVDDDTKETKEKSESKEVVAEEDKAKDNDKIEDSEKEKEKSSNVTTSDVSESNQVEPMEEDSETVTAAVVGKSEADATTTDNSNDTTAAAVTDSNSMDATVSESGATTTAGADSPTASTSTETVNVEEASSNSASNTATDTCITTTITSTTTTTNLTSTTTSTTTSSTTTTTTSATTTTTNSSNSNEQTQNDTVNTTTSCLGLDEEESVAGSYPPTQVLIDDNSATLWPSMQDLNTRLRRVITAYQRNYKKEELKQQQKAKKMERQGKMEIAAREREMQRLQSIPKKWNRREEYEFLRVLTGYGIDLLPTSALAPGISTLAPDWTKFKQMAHLERKSDETLSDYYKVFITMCKRQAGVKLSENEKGLEGIIEDISEDHAKLILDRLELLSKLREISKHPQMEERLKLCMVNADTPDWWEPGKHDKELIAAVLKHGLYRSKTFIFNDHTFSFADSEKRFLRELEAQMQRSIKLEAYNAEKLAAATKPLVKDEIIDLDEELLTKDSLIKKENFSPVKAEIKNESVAGEIKTDTAEKEIVEEGKTEDLKTIKENMDTQDLTKDEDDEVLLKLKNNAKNTQKKIASEPETNEDENIDQNVEEMKTVEKEIDKKERANEKIEEMEVEKEESLTEDLSGSKDQDKSVEQSNKSSEQEKSNDKVSENEAEKPDRKDEEKESICLDKDKTEIDENVKEVDNKKVKVDEDKAKEATEKEAAKIEKPKDEEEMLDLTTATSGSNDPDDEEVMKEKEKAVEEECKKQAAELKARFPDLEVIQPGAAKHKQEKPKLEISISWFKDFALERRIYHIVSCIDSGKWPVDKSYSALAGCKGIELNIGLHEAIPHLSVAIEKRSTTPDVITITTDHGVTKHLPTSQVQQVVTPVVSNVTATPIAASNVPASTINTTSISSKSSLTLSTSTTAPITTVSTPATLPAVSPASNTSSSAAATAAAAAAASLGGLDANSFNAAMAAAVAAAGGNASALSALLPGMSLTALSGLNIPSASSSGSSNSNNTTAANSGKKRKRHIAIDVETERAKLHALLNSAQTLAPKDWETEIANMTAAAAVASAGVSTSSRRSSSSAASPGTNSNLNSALQPPPAHQHAPLSRQNSGQFSKPAVPPLKTPPPSSMGGAMDLSSSLPKMNMADIMKSASSSGAIDLSEVQDFSMGSKKLSSSSSSSLSAANTSSIHAALSSAFPSMASKGGKLDDTLNKLMKKNNCIIEEPVVGKEKKRKKLDEIVLGLSAAKEQKTFPDPSLPSSKKPQIPPSVSVTPANIPTSLSSQQQQQQNQKPFTITVTTVPGKGKSNSSSAVQSSSTSSSSSANTGLSALQNMAGMGGLSSKDSLNALLAQTMATDPQTFLKQQQKMMQCLPPAQRKLYESMLADMEQAMKSSKYGVPHETKVDKWLTDVNSPLTMDYAGGSSGNNGNSSNTTSSNSRRSSRQQSSTPAQQSLIASQMSSSKSSNSSSHNQTHQQQQQQQSSMSAPQGLTGDEPVPVINKQTGKRLAGNKAPQLKRLMQWLTENPNYEVDPKWLEQMQNPMSAPSPKPMESSYTSSSKSHSGRPSSTSSNASSGSHSNSQQQSSSQSSSSNSSSSKKSSRQSAMDQANAAMQFGSLAGLNPSLLAGLPNLGGFDPKNPLSAFDPKNPLLSMPFAGLPGMGNLPGLGNLNNMNLFASLAGMGGLGNLAGMDTQSLAALMAAAGPALSGLGGVSGSSTNSGSNSKNSSQSNSSSSKKSKNDQQAQQNAAAAAAALGATSSGGNNSSSSSNAKSSAAAAAASASQLAAGFPFLFANPSLLYPPMGMSGLNPYSLGSTGLGSAYDQLAQQYLMNGVSSSGSTSTTQSKAHQSQSKSSNSRSSASSATSSSAAQAANLMNAMAASMSGSGGQSSNSSQSSSSRGRQSSASRAAAQASAEMAQLSNLLMPPADAQLLESFSRMANMDLAQATRLMSSLGMPPISGASTSSSNTISEKRSSSSSSASNAAAAAAQQAAKEQQKLMEQLARGQLPTDLATLQALSQGKLPPSMTGGASSSSSSNTSSNSSSSKSAKAAAAAAAAAAATLPQIPGMSADFSQAFLAEMAAQAMAAAGGSLPLTGPGSLASLTGSLAGLTGGSSNSAGSSSSASSALKRQRDQDALAKDAFQKQMDYYTKQLGLGSGISLIPTSASATTPSSYSSNSSAQDQDHHKSKRQRSDTSSSSSLKDDLNTAAALAAAGFPLNLGGGMTSIEKSIRGSSSSSNQQPEADKVTLTPLNSAGIAANLPSQTTITIAPPISSGASSSSERSERSESRISLTITNAAEAAKMPPPYEEADELIIQPILKKPPAQTQSQQQQNPSTSTSQTPPTSTANSTTNAVSHSGSIEDMTTESGNNTPSTSTNNEETRRSSGRLKRPRSGADHSLISEQPLEKRRELRSTRHTRQSSSGSAENTLNLSTNSENEEKPE